MFLKNVLPGWPGAVYSLSQSAIICCCADLAVRFTAVVRPRMARSELPTTVKSPRDDGGGPFVVASLPSFCQLTARASTTSFRC